jgi:hypothetical protein
VSRPGRAHSDASTMLKLKTDADRGDKDRVTARQSKQTGRSVRAEAAED